MGVSGDGAEQSLKMRCDLAIAYRLPSLAWGAWAAQR